MLKSYVIIWTYTQEGFEMKESTYRDDEGRFREGREETPEENEEDEIDVGIELEEDEGSRSTRPYPEYEDEDEVESEEAKKGAYSGTMPE